MSSRRHPELHLSSVDPEVSILHGIEIRAVSQDNPGRLDPSQDISTEARRPKSLAITLLEIQEKRGTLFMLDTCRYLIEAWNLQFDRLDAQTEETASLVTRLLCHEPSSQ
jgi:hypothetical protein